MAFSCVRRPKIAPHQNLHVKKTTTTACSSRKTRCHSRKTSLSRQTLVRPLFAVRPGATGDITLQKDQTANEYIAWCQKKAGPYNPSPIVYGDYLYVLYDRGLMACYDARTGEEVYGKRRIGPGASAFTSSPWAYDGKVFCLSEDGDTFVIQAGPEFKLLGKNSLGELCMATPAIARDSLIIRTESHLLRIK